MTSRPERSEVYMAMAKVLAERSTCARRKVGCILTDRTGRILATGYNGTPRGMAHCIDHPCPGVVHPSGIGLHECEAIHAEQNALIQCAKPDEIYSAHCTTAPCIHCLKMLMNTGTRHILFRDPYPGWEETREFWTRSLEGRTFIKFD